MVRNKAVEKSIYSIIVIQSCGIIRMTLKTAFCIHHNPYIRASYNCTDILRRDTINIFLVIIILSHRKSDKIETKKRRPI